LNVLRADNFDGKSDANGAIERSDAEKGDKMMQCFIDKLVEEENRLLKIMKTPFPMILSSVREFRDGEKCRYCNEVLDDTLQSQWLKKKPKLPHNKKYEDLNFYEKAKYDEECKKVYEFNAPRKEHNKKVIIKDHNHITGLFRGYAHSSCNVMVETIFLSLH